MTATAFSLIAHNVIPHNVMAAASLSIIGLNMHGAADLMGQHWMKPVAELTEADCFMAAAIVIVSEYAGHLPGSDADDILDMIGVSIDTARSVSGAMRSITL